MSVFNTKGFYRGGLTGVIVYVNEANVGTTTAKVIEVGRWEAGEVGDETTWLPRRFDYLTPDEQDIFWSRHQYLCQDSTTSTSPDNRVFFEDLCGEEDQVRRAVEKLHGLQWEDHPARNWQDLRLLPNNGHQLYDRGRKVLWYSQDFCCLYECTIVGTIDGDSELVLRLDKIIWDQLEREYLPDPDNLSVRLTRCYEFINSRNYVPVWDMYPTEGCGTECKFVRYDGGVRSKVFGSAYKYGLSRFYEKFEKKETENECNI